MAGLVASSRAMAPAPRPPSPAEYPGAEAGQEAGQGGTGGCQVPAGAMELPERR